MWIRLIYTNGGYTEFHIYRMEEIDEFLSYVGKTYRDLAGIKILQNDNVYQ